MEEPARLEFLSRHYGEAQLRRHLWVQPDLDQMLAGLLDRLVEQDLAAIHLHPRLGEPASYLLGGN